MLRILLPLILIFQLYLVSMNATYQNIELDSNSDLIYPISFFLDIQNGVDISNWVLPPAPSFFPDLFLYFIAWKISSGLIYLSFFLYALIFEFILFLCLFLLLRNSNMDDARHRPINDPILQIMIFLFFINELMLSSPSRFALFLFPGYHGFVVAFGIFLTIAINFRNGWILFAVFLFTFLFSISDGQAILQSIIPCIAILIVIHFRKKTLKRKSLLLMLCIIAGLAFAIMANSLLRRYGLFQIPEVPFTSLLKSIIKQNKALINFATVFGLIRNEFISNSKNLLWIAYAVFYMGAFLFFPSQFKKNKTFFYILMLSVFFANFVQFFFGVWGGMRYSWFLTFMPFFILLFNEKIVQSILTFLLIGLTFLLSIYLYLVTPQTSIKFERILKNPYPTNVECLDLVADELHLENGYSDYWNAKYFMLFSKKKLKLKQLTQNLDSYEWIYNPEWTKNVIKYDFLITNRINKNSIQNKLPPPDEIRTCEKLEIFVYKNRILLQ